MAAQMACLSRMPGKLARPVLRGGEAVRPTPLPELMDSPAPPPVFSDFWTLAHAAIDD